jgi:hypothetical protein
MTLKNRIGKLEVEFAHEGGGLAGVTRSLKGLPLHDVLVAVEQAVAQADKELVRSVVHLCHEAWQRPRHDPPLSEDHRFYYEGCNEEKDEHYFVFWIRGLMCGSWSLPIPTIPRVMLVEFNHDRSGIFSRCEHCRTALPRRAGVDGCPVCGAARTMISQKKNSGPPWDPPWVYTPLPRIVGYGRQVPWPAESYPEGATVPPASTYSGEEL